MKYILFLIMGTFAISTSYNLGKVSRIHEEYSQFSKCQEKVHNESMTNEKIKRWYKQIPFEIAYQYTLGRAYDCVLKQEYK